MLDIFSSEPIRHNFQLTKGGTGFYSQEAAVYRYYSSFNRLGNCGELLIRLIKHLDTSSIYDLESSMNTVADRADSVLFMLGIATDYSKGRIQQGNLFENCSEFFIATPFSNWLIADDWRRAMPLKLIEHSFTDFSYKFKKEPNRGTTAYFLLDVDLLMSSFFRFKKETLISTSDVYDLGVKDYVQRFVLPKVLTDKMRLSSLNRMLSLVRGDIPDTTDPAVSFYSESAIAKLDMDLVVAYKNYMKRNNVTGLSGFLSMPIPLSRGTISEILAIPEPSPLTVASWHYYAARIRLLNFMLGVSSIAGVKDRHTWIVIYNELKQIVQAKQYSDILPRNEALAMEELFIKISNYLKGKL